MTTAAPAPNPGHGAPPDTTLLDVVAAALRGNPQATTAAEQAQAQWRSAEAWVDAVTCVRLAALQALPEGLHPLI